MAISDATHNRFEIVELGGREYKLSAVTLNDLGEIESRVRAKKAAELKSVCEASGLVGVDAANYIADKLSKIDILEVLISDKATKAEHSYIISMITFYGIKKKHPEVNVDDIFPHINMGNMVEISNKMRALSSPKTSEKKEDAQTANP